jgi:hypothetical protein
MQTEYLEEIRENKEKERGWGTKVKMKRDEPAISRQNGRGSCAFTCVSHCEEREREREREREPGEAGKRDTETDRRRRGRHFRAKGDLERKREKEGGAEK